MPASRRAQAMIWAPRSGPSSPTFATTTLIIRSINPILTGRVRRASDGRSTDHQASPRRAFLRVPERGTREAAHASRKKTLERADHVPGPDAWRHAGCRGEVERRPSRKVLLLVPARAVFVRPTSLV